ncbi:MAG: 50S ribosomal protein L11 methyltransferase [Deltaproteobacteria bacterium]|nr:50S ribosomal protein L11 methyltransferase [Deltaproteobacteria bacterium]
MKITKLFAASVVVAAAVGCQGSDQPAPGEKPKPAFEDTSALFTQNVEAKFKSKILGGELVVLPGVFWPGEAETTVLPLMRENRGIFPNKVVLEIGTGSGAAGVYAAKLGASKVVVTDINPNAIASARRNAKAFGVQDVVEARLVSADDISAFAVIPSNEKFDVILSNPPYSLDLDAPKNDAVTDTGDLGFSIVDGLDEHLKPGGRAMLFYGSLFYHMVMVKYATYSGFEVRSHRPFTMTRWEASVLFNSYLRRLLETRGVDPDAFRFSYREKALNIHFKPIGKEPPLVEGSDSERRWGGWMVIRRPSGA